METKFKISLNSGDLISCLPGIRQLYRTTGKKAIIYQTINRQVEHPYPEHPIQDESGHPVTCSLVQYNMLKPLLEAQEYIQSFEIYNGQEFEIDLDKPREYNLSIIPNAPLHQYSVAFYPQMACDLSENWIEVEGGVPADLQNLVIINRTDRYNNPHINYFFLKKYVDRLIFAGTKDEHQSFCKQYNLKIPYLSVNNFLELAVAIKNCYFFLGCQSMCFHIADAMHVPRILEVCQFFPNSFPTGANGYPFLFQESLEYYFTNLISD